MDITVVTQLHYQVYIIYQHQLHVSAIAAVAILRLDKFFYQRRYINMICNIEHIISAGKGERDLVLHKVGGCVCRW